MWCVAFENVNCFQPIKVNRNSAYGNGDQRLLFDFVQTHLVAIVNIGFFLLCFRMLSIESRMMMATETGSRVRVQGRCNTMLEHRAHVTISLTITFFVRVRQAKPIHIRNST